MNIVEPGTTPSQHLAAEQSALQPFGRSVLDCHSRALRPATTPEYISSLQQSGLISSEDFQSFVSHDAQADISNIETRLVARGLVTPWQSNMLRLGFDQGYFLGRYRLLKLIGSGGMARVYLAEHDVMKRRVAIKVLSQISDPSSLKRFMAESRAIAALDNPNIVRVHHFDSDGDVYYLVMEYIDGEDLRHIVERRGPLPVAEAAGILRQAASGLRHAHELGLIHRDVKPANLLVDAQGLVKLADLGLARISVEATSVTQATGQEFLGTVNYIAPEQVLDCHAVDARADLYGLGCTLYFMLSGHPPFPEGRPAERMAQHLYAKPVDLSTKRPDIPPELADLCQRLMAKQPETRPQSAADVCAYLDAYLAEQRGETAQTFDSGEATWSAALETWSKQCDSSTRSPESTFQIPTPAQPASQAKSHAEPWPEVMLVDEVAAYLRISPASVESLAAEGKIPSQYIGADLRFHRDSISRWLRETNFRTSSWNGLIPKPSLNQLVESRISTSVESGGTTSMGRFVDVLRASELLDDEEIRSLSQYAASQPAEDPQRLALELARQGKLTDYQASVLLRGKTDGLTYGNYAVLEHVGSGGMATVLKARHRQTGQIVALKVLSPESSHCEDGYRRFDREIRAIARLQHANIVRAIDASYQDDVAYFVMEYVDGPNLHQIVRRRGQLSVATAIDYITQAARGLDHAHQQGIIHRDVKPGNLLVNSSGVVKLLDMGLVRFDHSQLLLASTRSVERITREEMLLGTPDFMAPEQFSDPTRVDQRADVYSLGCTLYFMLTGKYPFDRDNINAVLTAHQTDVVPKLSAHRDDIPPGLQQVLERMLAKSPAQRPASMIDVIDELQRALDRSVHQADVEKSNQPAPASPIRSVLGSALIMMSIAAVAAYVRWPWANELMNAVLDPAATGVQKAIMLTGLAGVGGATVAMLVRELSPRK